MMYVFELSLVAVLDRTSSDFCDVLSSFFALDVCLLPSSSGRKGMMLSCLFLKGSQELFAFDSCAAALQVLKCYLAAYGVHIAMARASQIHVLAQAGGRGAETFMQKSGRRRKHKKYRLSSQTLGRVT